MGQLTDRIRELENQLARLELEKQHMKSVSSSFDCIYWKRFELEKSNLKTELENKQHENNQKQKDNDIQSISNLYEEQIQLLKKRLQDLENEKQGLEEIVTKLKGEVAAAAKNERVI